MYGKYRNVEKRKAYERQWRREIADWMEGH